MLLPLISEEVNSSIATSLLQEDGDVTVWWGTWSECAVAISRIRREGGLDEEREEMARDILDILAEAWIEIRPEDDLRLLSTLLSKYHPLKAADCFQLAAALRWCEGYTNGAGFVCLDDRLHAAAVAEGFDVLPGQS